MTVKKLKRSMEIFEKYLEEDKDDDVSANHDIIYACGVPPAAFGGDDLRELEALGWSWSEEFACWEAFA